MGRWRAYRPKLKWENQVGVLLWSTQTGQYRDAQYNQRVDNILELRSVGNGLSKRRQSYLIAVPGVCNTMPSCRPNCNAAPLESAGTGPRSPIARPQENQSTGFTGQDNHPYVIILQPVNGSLYLTFCHLRRRRYVGRSVGRGETNVVFLDQNFPSQLCHRIPVKFG